MAELGRKPESDGFIEDACSYCLEYPQDSGHSHQGSGNRGVSIDLSDPFPLLRVVTCLTHKMLA